MEVAKKEGMRLFEGIYVMTGGPHYETPAEVAMLREMGGDAVGMSTCPEVIVAAQCGIKVFGFSVITNMANTDIDDAVVVSHEQILKVATEAGSIKVATFLLAEKTTYKVCPIRVKVASLFHSRKVVDKNPTEV
ncbi:unnamed protein product [Nippostrongylus brasiliensis]|uniref:purine-nucleoside phosphorylase n=1 Tax=Nippostrongylus brasiliensis TaxID=27835 RepID=A0A0N4YWP2_NIPBR|nr:unnamed protein product [Nippostrongylus brasiliensis]